MTRKDLQDLASIRLKEAKALLDQGLHDGAYYLCGYAVECTLKACIAKNVKQHDFPDKKAVIDSHLHDIEKLIRVSGLEPELRLQIQKNQEFKLNWQVVRDWSEISRYKRSSEFDATDLYFSIVDEQNGIMP
jgi:HEPN domain-containing protein